MLRTLLTFAVLIAIGACASPGTPRPTLTQAELLSGDALPDRSDLVAQPLTERQIFALDDEMRAFVATQIAGAGSADVKLRRLLRGMQARGLFSLDYDASVTRTAAETFYKHQANCLSFTVLFVALAREAGLRASYQMVDIPPEWSSESDLLLLSTHINALVEIESEADYVVDFNIVGRKGNYDKRKVNDQYALALFYSNLGVDALVDGDYGTSFVYLRSAIEVFPAIPGPWVNLGLLYARQRLSAQAESAYLHALEVDADSRSAMTNLASLYATIGDTERAALYSQRIAQYQARNPYYHYSLAQRAYGNEQFATTLDLLDAAIRLKHDEHQFYFLQALAYYRLGERQKAERSLLRAKEYAQFAEIKTRYESGIEALAGSGPPS